MFFFFFRFVKMTIQFLVDAHLLPTENLSEISIKSSKKKRWPKPDMSKTNVVRRKKSDSNSVIDQDAIAERNSPEAHYCVSHCDWRKGNPFVLNSKSLELCNYTESQIVHTRFKYVIGILWSPCSDARIGKLILLASCRLAFVLSSYRNTMPCQSVHTKADDST